MSRIFLAVASSWTTCSHGIPTAGFVGDEGGVAHEQDIVVELLARPTPALLERLVGARLSRLIEADIFLFREPCRWRDLA